MSVQTPKAKSLKGEIHDFAHVVWTYLGKLSYFTSLISSAVKGDDFPKKSYDSQGSGEQGSVVMKFTQTYGALFEAAARPLSKKKWIREMDHPMAKILLSTNRDTKTAACRVQNT